MRLIGIFILNCSVQANISVCVGTPLFVQAVPGLFGVISVSSASGNFRKWF